MTESDTIDRNALISELGLTIESAFVPWSRSRNAKEKHPSLNWKVTVKRDGREILTTDYSAGSGHAPSYKQPGFGKRTIADQERDDRVAWECENGRKFGQFDNPNCPSSRPVDLQPAILDVLHSLVMDSDALDAGGFESWASDLGYDTDSRQAEKTYQACLEIALKMRGALGDASLQRLRDAFQDY